MIRNMERVNDPGHWHLALSARSEYFRQLTISAFAYRATSDGRLTLMLCQTIMRGKKPLAVVGVILLLTLSAFRPGHMKQTGCSSAEQ